jgi:hypothetical protein
MDPYLQSVIDAGRIRAASQAAPSPSAPSPTPNRDILEALQSDNHEIRAAASVVLDRIMFLRQAGITFNGARDLYAVLGYDRLITTRQYRDRYARGGIAGRIIDTPVNATWRGVMEVVEDKNDKNDTEFEKAWKTANQRLQIQAKLQRADRLAGLSTYSVILLGVRGQGVQGEDILSQELPKGRPEDLMYLAPFLGGGGPGGDTRSRAAAVDADCTIMEYETDVSSPRFGLPKLYQLRRTDISSPAFQRPVHWSRIIHVAEGILDNEVYGLPALERVWNLLDDLDKVTGGGAEAFWLRANQGLHMNIDKDMALPVAAGQTAAQAAAAQVESLKQQSEEYKHQLTRWLRTRGVEVNTLGSDTADFANPADAILTQIAGSKAIPKRILTGSEMGELASSQDRDNWKDQVNGRQTQYAGPYIVRQLVDRLIDYGYLPPPSKGQHEYTVKWPNVQTLTEEEKAQGAKQWASTNATQGMTVFTEEEIRDKWYGMEPLKPELKVPVKGRMSTPQPEDGGEEPPQPRTLEEGTLLRQLESALEENDFEAVGRLIGGRASSTQNIEVHVPAPVVNVKVDQGSRRTTVTKRDRDSGAIIETVSEGVGA